MDSLIQSLYIAQIVFQDGFELIQRFALLVDDPISLDPDVVALDAHPVSFPPVSPLAPWWMMRRVMSG